MRLIDAENTYDIVYSDPPWQQSKGNARKCRPKQGKSLDYPTMTIEDIFAIQKPFFDKCSDKHNIFLWSIDKYLHTAEKEMEKLGYKLHARFVWDKGNGIAPAFTVRFAHEYLLWFYRPGKMLMPCKECRGKYTTVLREPSTYHSHKPDCAYKMIEDMFPEANKIELFARNRRSGWISWGNEVT